MKLPRGRLRLVLILLGALALVLVVQRLLFRDRPVPVDTAAVAAGDVEEIVANSEAGTVKARSRAMLSVERAGRVSAILYREGTRARAGALLLRLDPGTESRRLEAARRDLDSQRAALQAALASASQAKRNLDRIAALKRQGLASQEQLEQAQAAYDVAAAEARAAQARERSARAAVGVARDEIAHIEIRAPFDGVVARRLCEVGEAVTPGQPLLELVGDENLYVSAPIDERDAGRLREGLPARVTVDTYPGIVWNGSVTRVAPVVEEVKEQSRTLEVEVGLPEDPSKPQVRPGMTADVEIVLARKRGVVRVPTFSVLEGRRVYVVERNRAVSREVTTGARNWEWTEIRSGLRPGERVVTTLDRPGLEPGAALAPTETAPKP